MPRVRQVTWHVCIIYTSIAVSVAVKLIGIYMCSLCHVYIAYTNKYRNATRQSVISFCNIEVKVDTWLLMQKLQNGIRQRTYYVVVVTVFTMMTCILMMKVTHIRKRPLLPFNMSAVRRTLNSTEPLNHKLKSVGRLGTITLPTALTQHSDNTTEPFTLTGSVEEEQDQSLSVAMIPEHDTMPFQTYLKSREELQKTEWVSTLHNFLQTLDKSVSPHVNLVFGDDDHRHLVLNWITAALMVLEPPLHNAMVLSLDHSLCDFLTTRKLPLTCIAVPVESVIILNLRGKSNQWSLGLMVRLPVLRLINYWGYDVAAYDSDAVLLCNPQVLFTERPNMDVFSTAGTFPHDVSKQWGFTLCAGTIILRATPAVGMYTS